MSWDVLVQGFRDGDGRESDAAAVAAALAPYVVEIHGEHAVLRVGDAVADLYGIDDLANGFMVNRVSGAAWDAVVAAARAGAMTILLPGCPTAITDEGQRAHLPPELAEDGVVLVRDGEDLRRLIDAC